MRVGAIDPHTKYEAKAATTGPDGEILAGIYQRMTRIKQNEGRFRAVLKSGKLVRPCCSPRRYRRGAMGQSRMRAPATILGCYSNPV